VPAVWAAAIRLALAAVLLTAVALAIGQRLPTGAARRAAIQFGVLNFGINFPLLYWGEREIPSGLAAVFYATIPITTALFTRAFGLERLSWRKMVAALIAFAGVAVIFSGELDGRARWAPMLAVLLSATVASLSGIFLKRGPRQPPLGANAVGAMAGFPVCLAASFLLGEPHALPDTARAWFPILYLTIAGSLGAYVLYAWLVNAWPLSRVSFVAVVVPVVALVIGAIAAGEQLSALAWGGSVLVLVGLLLAIRPERTAPA
jgi:drug/metabolite transporter (DMT)-like permease